MKNLLFTGLSVLILNTAFASDTLAHTYALGISTGPTNPSPRQPYLGGGA